MTLKEAIEVLENSSVEYIFQNGDDDTELNLDRLIPGREDILIEVQKDGETIVYLCARNTSTELVAVSDASVKLYDFGKHYSFKEDDFYIYYFQGLCDGNNEVTINLVKELMAEYGDTMKENYGDTWYSLKYYYTYETSEGEDDGFVSFSFNLKDGSFRGFDYY